jgi:hypothetical protein
MKKIIKSSLSVALLLAFGMSSCTKNELFYFDNKSNTALNIWLGTENTAFPSRTHNFAYQVEGTQFEFLFYVRLTGAIADYDRKFTLEQDSGDFNKISYEVFEYVLPAGQHQASFPIRFNKPAGFNSFADSVDGIVVFRIKENEHFKTGVTERSRLVFRLKNVEGKPENWDAEESGYSRLSNYFGTYSAIKYGFILEVSGLPTMFRVRNLWPEDPVIMNNPDLISQNEAVFIRDLCKAIQLEREAINGPFLDENGNRIVFP